MRLNGRVAIVTGAGRGIGRSIGLRLAKEGASVVIADIVRENAAKVVEEVKAAGGKALAMEVDVTEQASVEQLVANTVHSYGRLDILVNNAGIGLTKLFLNTTLAEWERILRTDLTGVFLCAQAAARVMVQQGGGRIINIASLSGQRGGTGRSAYGAAKAGVTALTKVLSVELAPCGITVNDIAPGPVNTEMSAVTHDPATRQAYYDLIPMRRYGECDEIAAAAAFLASDDATYINGHTLNVDGGFRAAGLIFDLKE